MLDFANETPLTVRDAAARLPGSPHPSTLHRWFRHGLRGIRLESCLVGGRRVTSVEALARFSRAVTERADQQPGVTRHEDSTAESIEAALERAGP